MKISLVYIMGVKMENFIEEKMDLIFNDFNKNLEKIEYYCKLKEFRFDSKSAPDYDNKIIQQYYLLKYLPAYCVEYYSIYQDVIKKKYIREDYNVLSIGCGCYLDLWGLVFALEDSPEEMGVRYTGLDVIDWGYWDDLNQDAGFIQTDISQLEELDEQAYNIIIFPKSIGEFDDVSFAKLLKAVEKTVFTSNRLIVISSLRNTRKDYDIDRLKLLINVFKNNHGYCVLDDVDVYTHYKKKDNGYDYRIGDIIPGLEYPEYIKNYLISFYSNCQGLDEECDSKEECKKLFTRYPITTMSQVNYQIIRLERK